MLQIYWTNVRYETVVLVKENSIPEILFVLLSPLQMSFLFTALSLSLPSKTGQVSWPWATISQDRVAGRVLRHDFWHFPPWFQNHTKEYYSVPYNNSGFYNKIILQNKIFLLYINAQNRNIFKVFWGTHLHFSNMFLNIIVLCHSPQTPIFESVAYPLIS